MNLDKTTMAIVYLGLFIGIPLVLALVSMRIAVRELSMTLRVVAVGLTGSFAKRRGLKVAGGNPAPEPLSTESQSSLPGAPV